MPVIALDLGGTKLASAVFFEHGDILSSAKQPLEKRTGRQVGEMMAHQLQQMLSEQKKAGREVTGIGVSVPGISHGTKGTVWAPNIEGWEDYPLLEELKSVAGVIPVSIDSDRACSILGECWQGNARSCTDAVFMAVGTGIGVGIMAGGMLIRGAHDIAGAIGWMALERPYKDHYRHCGCFENSASGDGIAKLTRALLEEKKDYNGILRHKQPALIVAADVFSAWQSGDELASEVLGICTELWGMAVANLVSLLNPEKIILGGGVFGPAVPLIPAIRREALKWAQPVSVRAVEIVASQLGPQAGLYGAALLALNHNTANI